MTGVAIETLIADANEDELRMLARLLKRANDRPAILATVGKRRYVVDQEFEQMFDSLIGLSGEKLTERVRYSNGAYFGAQWLRGYGRVDEMYRTLGLYEVTRVQTADRKRVWGR